MVSPPVSLNFIFVGLPGRYQSNDLIIFLVAMADHKRPELKAYPQNLCIVIMPVKATLHCLKCFEDVQ